MEELKKCPFCGGEASIVNSYSVHRKRIFVYVRCDVCNSQGKTYTTSTKKEMGENNPANKYAVNAWNLRNERKND